jgi:threonine dehydratase
MIDVSDIRHAAGRIEGLIHNTPVMTSQRINELAGAELFFKCENLQKAGAFKSRGAVNAVFSLGEDELQKGVATHSSGNHGAALARAAGLRNTPAYIVVPNDAKQVKKEAITGYGGELILCEPTLAARESALQEVVADTGATVVHPYDNDLIIAGQGTAALELMDQVSGLDALVTPVGGGGLLAGCSLVAAEQGVEIYGAEPAGADDAYRSVRDGKRIENHVPHTICDGLLTVLGARNFEIIRKHTQEILLVPDEQTIDAMALIWTRMKLVVEPSSAITLAAVLAAPEHFRNKRVGLVLTGGNIDLHNLPF